MPPPMSKTRRIVVVLVVAALIAAAAGIVTLLVYHFSTTAPSSSSSNPNPVTTPPPPPPPPPQTQPLGSLGPSTLLRGSFYWSPRHERYVGSFTVYNSSESALDYIPPHQTSSVGTVLSSGTDAGEVIDAERFNSGLCDQADTTWCPAPGGIITTGVSDYVLKLGGFSSLNVDESGVISVDGEPGPTMVWTGGSGEGGGEDDANYWQGTFLLHRIGKAWTYAMYSGSSVMQPLLTQYMNAVDLPAAIFETEDGTTVLPSVNGGQPITIGPITVPDSTINTENGLPSGVSAVPLAFSAIIIDETGGIVII